MITSRFAPSPTGRLHLGHAFSALTAAAQGDFLLRIEDIDRERCRPEYEAATFEDLAWLGLTWPQPVMRQSDRMAAYQDALARLADAEGFLIVDEAHATGVWGPQGRGLAHALEGRANVITLHTLGKALGGSGALLCLPAVLRDFLVNRARPFIFATASSPLMEVAGAEALDILRDEPERRQALHDLIGLFAARMARALPHLPMSGSQIVPLVVGADGAAMALAARLQQAGFDLRGIRPPTVPAGTARLRVSLTLNAAASDVERLVDTLGAEWPAL